MARLINPSADIRDDLNLNAASTAASAVVITQQSVVTPDSTSCPPGPTASATRAPTCRRWSCRESAPAELVPQLIGEESGDYNANGHCS